MNAELMPTAPRKPTSGWLRRTNAELMPTALNRTDAADEHLIRGRVVNWWPLERQRMIDATTEDILVRRMGMYRVQVESSSVK